MEGGEALLSGGLEILGLLPDATNYTFLARLESGTLVVYKPRRGETALWDFPRGTLCQRELAAFLVSEAGGWYFVPPTIMRAGPMGEGAVQLFIDHDRSVTAFDLSPSREDDLKSIAVFDLIINNADRKAGHVLMDSHGKLWAVDHGICFSHAPKLRTVLWDFIGQPFQTSDLVRLRQLYARLKEGLCSQLAPLLEPEELAALSGRIQTALDHPAFPPPGAGRPYPWPPV